MTKLLTCLLAGALLAAGPAQAQAPATEVAALTKRLNELMREPHPKEHTEVLVSLAGCGVRQTVRKFRSPDEASTTNISVSSSKNGSSWGVRSNEKVEFELSLGLDWSEIGAVSYQLETDQKTDQPHYTLRLLRRPATAEGKKTSGIDSISLPLYTRDEQEVAALVRRLGAVRRQCTNQKG